MPLAHRHGLPRIIDEQLLARPMLVAQTPIQGLEPDAISVTEAAVLIAVGMGGLILLPQQGQGDPLAGELLMDRRPLWHGPAGPRARRSLRIQPGFQGRVIDLHG